MKSISFVLYANQLLSITYIGGLMGPKQKQLEDKLKDTFESDYEVNFSWEESIKGQSVDALIVPEPFPPIENKSSISIIKVPAQYFYLDKMQDIKNIVDNFFIEWLVIMLWLIECENNK